MSSLLLNLLALYAAIGLLSALWLLTLGLPRLDPALSASPRRVRLLLLPGCIGLWPLLLAKTLKRDRP